MLAATDRTDYLSLKRNEFVGRFTKCYPAKRAFTGLLDAKLCIAVHALICLMA